MNSKMIQHKTLRPKTRHFQPRLDKLRRYGGFSAAALTALLGVAGCGGGSLGPTVPGASSNDAANLLYPYPTPGVTPGHTPGPTPGRTPGATPGPTTSLPAFKITTLVSDTPVAGAQHDPHLINGWGIAFSSFSTIWVSANGTGTTTVYDGTGRTVLPPITIPAPPGQTGPSAPTGQIFNPGASFKGDKFILSTEDGTISGWQGGSAATLRVNEAPSGAVYKGLATATVAGRSLLYATDFHGAKIDVFDSNYNLVHLTAGFKDTNIPPGFAPFNINNYGGFLIVTYARQDAEKHDDVKGVGSGFVDVYDTNGRLIQRLLAHGALNSPWGAVLTPDNFGTLSHRLLVGNFGDGRISVYNAGTGAFLGQLKDKTGAFIVLDGLWGLAFGNGTAAGKTNQLFFSSGPGGEKHGRFGRLDLAL